MAILSIRQEALNKLWAIRPAKPTATFFKALFLELSPIAYRAPLLRDALSLFDEHWSGSYGDKVQVFAHIAVDFLDRTAAKQRTNILRAKASAAHAAELQTQVSTIESKFATPTKEVPGGMDLKASGSANTRPQEALHIP